MNNILMRELPIKATIRLWDTYLSEEGGNGFARFHLYVCAAFLKEWKAGKKDGIRKLIQYQQYHGGGLCIDLYSVIEDYIVEK
jgi:hypothetical protein